MGFPRHGRVGCHPELNDDLLVQRTGPYDVEFAPEGGTFQRKPGDHLTIDDLDLVHVERESSGGRKTRHRDRRDHPSDAGHQDRWREDDDFSSVKDTDKLADTVAGTFLGDRP